MRIIFAGTPAFAAASLNALLATPHEICAVYTQPDRPAGRGRKLSASPVKQLALENGIPVEQPLNFRSEESRGRLAQYHADLMIVVAYGLLLPQAVLDTPRLGCINVHASLLPRWRGAAPIQRAILAGDHETGVCLMQMEAGLDTGPVLAQASCPIGEDDTGGTLHDRLAELGATLLASHLDRIEVLQQQARPQDDARSCYADKLAKEEALIDWSESARTLRRKVNAFNPWPVAQTRWRGEILRIWQAEVVETNANAEPGRIVHVDRQGIEVACGTDRLRITQLQLPGKRAMAVADFLNAHTPATGEQLG